jgi:hypothetical protein
MLSYKVRHFSQFNFGWLLLRKQKHKNWRYGVLTALIHFIMTISFLKEGFMYFFLFTYVIQHCFICRPSDSTELEDAGIEPRPVATLALTVRLLDVIHNRQDRQKGQ